MEERYLYEYDYAKPELTDEFLEHHGVLGMHWGIRKRPKYTGSLRQRIRKKKAYKSRVKALKKARKIKAKVSAEKKEAAKTKEEIIRTRDAAAMLKNIDKFTTQEINEFNNRENAISNLSKNADFQKKAKMTRGQKFKAFVKDAAIETGKNVLKKVITTAADVALSELASKSSSKILKTAFVKKDQDKKDKEQDDRISKLESGGNNKSESSKNDNNQKSSSKKNKTNNQQASSSKSTGTNQSKVKDVIKKVASNTSKDGKSEAVLNLQKQQLNMDYARSVASNDSNSVREKQYRSQIDKNIKEIDRLLEDIRKKK